MYFGIPVKRLCENQNWISEKWLILGIIIKVFSIHIFHYFFFLQGSCMFALCFLNGKEKENKNWGLKMEENKADPPACSYFHWEAKPPTSFPKNK